MLKSKMFLLIFVIMASISLYPSDGISITFVNQTSDQIQQDVFCFVKNMDPSFDPFFEGGVWKVMPAVAKGSSYTFTYPYVTTLKVTFLDPINTANSFTATTTVEVGKKYTINGNGGKLVLLQAGTASQSDAIEIQNQADCKGLGVSVNILKNDRLLFKRVMLNSQKATFIGTKLSWGIGAAGQIWEGKPIAGLPATLLSHDLIGVTSVTLIWTGIYSEGYRITLKLKM